MIDTSLMPNIAGADMKKWHFQAIFLKALTHLRNGLLTCLDQHTAIKNGGNFLSL